ncbi:unnamed protein product [Ixodes pacificus]
MEVTQRFVVSRNLCHRTFLTINMTYIYVRSKTIDLETGRNNCLLPFFVCQVLLVRRHDLAHLRNISLPLSFLGITTLC